MNNRQKIKIKAEDLRLFLTMDKAYFDLMAAETNVKKITIKDSLGNILREEIYNAWL